MRISNGRGIPWLWFALLALLVGGAVALISNTAIYLGKEPLGFWGLVYGTFGGVLALGLAATLSGRSPNAAKIGRIVVAVALAVLAIGTMWWIVMWGFSPWSLEGWWLYAMAAVALVAVAVLWRRA